MRINLYAQNRHTLILDGAPIAGFAEGDCFTVQLEGNGASRTKGADGPAMNLSTNQGGKITIKLNPTSPAIGSLYALREQQRSNPRLISIVLMTGVEEVITAGNCAFGDLPGFNTGGDKMSERSFEFECLNIQLDPSAVEAVDGGFLGGLVSGI